MSTEPYNDNNAADINSDIITIYQTYLNTIAPFIIQLETLDGEFPVEILNEIRAIFTHLARCSISDSISVKRDNIYKAERHVKRAILDCFKYMCVAYDDQYRDFEQLYKNIDLSVIDNGDFLPSLCKKRKLAIDYIKTARETELKSEDVDSSFSAFELAYNAYTDVYNFIKETEEKLIRVKTKAIKKERWRRILDISGLVGTVFGIVGVVLTIISFLN